MVHRPAPGRPGRGRDHHPARRAAQFAGVTTGRSGHAFPVKLALIHNPHGGHNRRHAPAVKALAANAQIPCREATTYDEITQAMREIGALGPDMLIVNGGDGTVALVVSCLRQAGVFAKEPILALLRGGTTNLIARDVGLNDWPERALRQLITAIAIGQEGELLQRAPFAVHGTNAPVPPMGFLFAGGALPAMLQRVRHDFGARGAGERRGEFRAMFQTAVHLLSGNLRSDPLMAPRLLQWSMCPSNPSNGMAGAMTALPGATRESGETVFHLICSLDRLVLGLNSARPTPSLRFLALRFPYRGIVLSLARLFGRRSWDRLDRNFIFREGNSLVLEFAGEALLDGEALPLATQPAKLELTLGAPLTFWRI